MIIWRFLDEQWMKTNSFNQNIQWNNEQKKNISWTVPIQSKLMKKENSEFIQLECQIRIDCMLLVYNEFVLQFSSIFFLSLFSYFTKVFSSKIYFLLTKSRWHACMWNENDVNACVCLWWMFHVQNTHVHGICKVCSLHVCLFLYIFVCWNYCYFGGSEGAIAACE